MTVGELISKLSHYSMDKEICKINCVSENMRGKIILTHKDTLEEINEIRRRNEEWNRQHSERIENQGEITSFANRW